MKQILSSSFYSSKVVTNDDINKIINEVFLLYDIWRLSNKSSHNTKVTSINRGKDFRTNMKKQ